MDKKVDVNLILGRCLKCGGELTCQSGCYSPASYVKNIESSIALEQGVCLNCGGDVYCPRCSRQDIGKAGGCLESRHRADEPFTETGKWALEGENF